MYVRLKNIEDMVLDIDLKNETNFYLDARFLSPW